MDSLIPLPDAGELSVDSELPTAPPVPTDAPPADQPATDEPVAGQIQEVEAAVVDVTHTIEHRCFGRPSADQPVVVTTYRS